MSCEDEITKKDVVFKRNLTATLSNDKLATSNDKIDKNIQKIAVKCVEENIAKDKSQCSGLKVCVASEISEVVKNDTNIGVTKSMSSGEKFVSLLESWNEKLTTKQKQKGKLMNEAESHTSLIDKSELTDATIDSYSDMADTESVLLKRRLRRRKKRQTRIKKDKDKKDNFEEEKEGYEENGEAAESELTDENIDSYSDMADNESVSSERKLRRRKKRQTRKKKEKEEEDINEEEKERQEENTAAAEGFIKTQMKFYEILKNSLLDSSKMKKQDHVINSLTPGKPGPVPAEPRSGGEREITKAISEAEKALEGTGGTEEGDSEEEGTIIEDLINSCRYQLVEDEDGLQLGGVAHFSDYALPFVYINGYKYTPLRDVLALFQPSCCPCQCTIPRSVFTKHKSLVKTFSTWEQVYKLELIKMKKKPTITTGDTLLKLDSLIGQLHDLIATIEQLHVNTQLKRSQNCDTRLYRHVREKLA